MKPVFHPPFLLLQEDSYSITPNRTSIWIVTLPKIWFIFRQNGCQTQNYIEARQMLCFPKDPPCRVFSARGRVITRKGGWRNRLTSSPQRLILQNGIIRSLRCRSSCCKLLLFPVLEFISWIGGGFGGGDDKANDYLCERSACGLESCFWCCLHCMGYGRLMWNFTANKSGQRGESRRKRAGLQAARGRRWGRCDRNAS